AHRVDRQELRPLVLALGQVDDAVLDIGDREMRDDRVDLAHVRRRRERIEFHDAEFQVERVAGRYDVERIVGRSRRLELLAISPSLIAFLPTGYWSGPLIAGAGVRDSGAS